MIKNTDDLKAKALEVFESIRSYQKRTKMSIKGKQISDGMGRKRVLEIIKTASCQ